MLSKFRVIPCALFVFAAACGDATGSSNGRVVVRFGTEASSARSNVSGTDAAFSIAAADELVVTGTNGTLKIEDIQLMVSEVKLKRAENSVCRHENKDEGHRANDECRKFEGGPFLIDLPLGGGIVTVLEAEVPEGTFRAVEFEIDDFEMDDDDEDNERQRASELFAQLRVLYPNAPARANMVVKGTFTPSNGNARPFIVYFDADLELRFRFEEPLVVEEGGGITVRVNPARWFEIGNRVRDLSALNGQLVEFELEMRNGFIRVDCDR
jgi:hypothetical protein